MNYEYHMLDRARLEALIHRAGAERSLFIGETLGHMLNIAWHAMGSVGSWLRRRAQLRPSPK
jgi:hypothetical protein